MRILLADNRAEVRSALRLLLEQATDVAKVAEAQHATALLAALDVQQPDVVLLDWELPGMAADALLATLRARQPFVRVIAMSSKPEARLPALSAGADDFVSKGDPPEKLLAALQLPASPDHRKACHAKSRHPGADPADPTDPARLRLLDPGVHTGASE